MMEQLSFFAEAGQSSGLPSHLLDYHPGFIDTSTGEKMLQQLIANTPWKHRCVSI